MLFLQVYEKKDLKNLQQSKLLRCSHSRINNLHLELRAAAGDQRYKPLVSVSALRLKSNAELSCRPCCMRVLLVSMGQGGTGMGTPSSEFLLGEQLLGAKTLDAEMSTQISNSGVSTQIYLCACVCIYICVCVSEIMTFDFWRTFSLFCTYFKSRIYKIPLRCSLSVDKPAFLLSEPFQIVKGESEQSP